MPFRGRLLCAALFLLSCVPLKAQHYLFAFNEGTQAAVYDAVTLEVLGQPAVGLGAIRAFGVPDQTDPTSFSKIYVLRTDAVLVLEPTPPFAVRVTRALQAPVSLGEGSASLTQDSRRFVVAAGRYLHVFDATNAADPTPTAIDMGNEITGLAVPPNTGRAYVTELDSDFVSVIDLLSHPPADTAGPIALPRVPTAIGAAPNASGVYAAATGSLFEINPRTSALAREIEGPSSSPRSITFNTTAPVPHALVRHGTRLAVIDLPRREPGVEFSSGNPLHEVVSPGGDLVYFSSTLGEIFQGNVLDGGFRQLNDPDTLAVFDLPIVDIEAGTSGQDLFLAFGGADGEIVHLNGDATLVRNRLVPSEPPTKLSVVVSPGTVAASFEVYGGNHQLGTVGQLLPKPLVVRAMTSAFRPAANQSVLFTTSTPNVVFDPPSPTTNHAGVAFTRVTVPITDPFLVDVKIQPANLTATFELNTAVEEEEGLSILSGDYQITVGGTDFPRPFWVLAVTGGVPIPNLTLDITTTNFGATCPSVVSTGANGEATFTCSASPVPAPVSTGVQVKDAFGRTLASPFYVTIVDNADKLPRSARVVSSTPVTGQVGTTVEDGIAIQVNERVSGLPIPNVGVEFGAAGDVTVSPAIAVTDSAGVARADISFGCELETNQISATLNSTDLPASAISYTSVRGPVTRVLALRGGNQSGNPGELLPMALVARTTDDCGNIVPSAPVNWQVDPPDAATLESAFGQTNAVGEASARVRIGNRPGPFTVRVTSAGVTAGFNLVALASVNRIVAISGDGQSLPAGSPGAQPLVVELQNTAGDPLANTQVNFRVIQGSGAVGDATATTDEAGRASTTVTAGSQAGTLRVEARAGEAVAVFTLTVTGRQPMVTRDGFVNGASFVAGWAPGSTGSIFGTGLMEGVDGVVAPPAPFPTTLRGVQVLVENVPAPILSMASINGQDQINIQVPFGIPAPAQVVVTVINNGASATVPDVPTYATQPGVFEFNLESGSFAAALHADFSLVEPDNPAQPGEVLQLYWTGGGATSPPVATNQPGPVPPAFVAADVVVVANGANAELLGSFYAPTLVTVYQTNFRVPEEAAGSTLRVRLMVGGAQSQEVMIPLTP